MVNCSYSENNHQVFANVSEFSSFKKVLYLMLKSYLTRQVSQDEITYEIDYYYYYFK